MLEEIARKKAEAEQVRTEAQRRSGEGGCSDAGGRGEDSPVRPDTDRTQE
jgi:hypothetical protein